MTKSSNVQARRRSLVAVLVLIAAALGSCSGGGLGLPPLSVVAFNFAPGFGGVHLNAPLEITFTVPVDPNTVNQDSIRIFTTTTTVAEPDPGAPAIGDFVVTGNVVRFLPQVPQNPALDDAGLRIGFTYTIQIPSSPDVIEPVRTIEGKPNVVSFEEFFSTLNQTILPAPGDITAEPNLNSLQLFFIDEGIENGIDPCPRGTLPPADQDSPQVIRTDPEEGESGFGTITGIQQGLGTAFVRLDPITVEFSEPISPWRIRPQNISIRNTNLGGETFDLFFFFIQDRTLSRLQITVFDADSAFDQASVPQGRYVLSLTQFTDLAGNPLVNSGNCVADGTFDLSFSTVSSPTLPTDLKLTFQDDDQDGHVDVGGLATAVNDPNIFPEHVAPFLGGFAIDHVAVPSPSSQTSSANWGNTAFWTGCEMRYDNGFDPLDPTHAIPDANRLRGGSFTAATAILSPLAGRAIGRSDPSGSLDGSVASAEPGKVDFSLVGAGTAALFTGDATTGPIVYHYNAFTLAEDAGGARPTLTYRKLSPDESLFPLIIFVEDDAFITGNIIVDGSDGSHGFNGANDGSTTYTPGGIGGDGGPGGGNGGAGGVSDLTGDIADPEKHNGQTGDVPSNVTGPLDELSEAMAGLDAMVTGGGGHFDQTNPKVDGDGDGFPDFIPAYSGGGGGGPADLGTSGGDWDGATTPGETDQGRGGQQVGTEPFDFIEQGILATGGGGGGGGSGDDDGGGTGAATGRLNNDLAERVDDGGGGGGGGGGFFGLACAGDVTLGEIDTLDPTIIRFAVIRAVGGRGGSTYAFSTTTGPPPVPADGPGGSPDITGPIGQGEAGGGGGGGGICIIAGGDLLFTALESYVHGKLGG
ncbi:MAG: Ig-like domain-containing domain, partial [Planctomycetota bacterium]